MSDHGVEYLEGILVGIQKSIERIEEWIVKGEDGHKKEYEAINTRMAALEQKLIHDNATRAAWHQLYGFIGATILACLTFFSGVFNNLFNHPPSH